MNKSEKNRQISKKYLLYAGLAFGIILILLSFLFDRNKVSENSTSVQKDYGTQLEEKLSSLIGNALGDDLSAVDVMITFENDFYSYADKNTPDFSYTQAFNSTNSQYVEKPLPKVKGVVIVCKNIGCQSDFEIIRKAAATALGIDNNKIYIIGGVTHT